MSNLLDATRILLARAIEQEIPLAEIARGAGAPVEYDWLKKFAGGEVPNPTVTRVQHLHDYLATRFDAKKPRTKVAANGRTAAR